MNAKQRRQLRKLREQTQSSPIIKGGASEGYTTWTYQPNYDKPEKEPEVAGVNVPPVIPEFDAKVDRNEWHNLSELPEWISTINRLTDKKSGWSWAYNTECKYIDIRVDMRDGGFVVLSREGEDGRRISLEHLKWQYKSLKEHKNEG